LRPSINWEIPKGRFITSAIDKRPFAKLLGIKDIFESILKIGERVGLHHRLRLLVLAPVFRADSCYFGKQI
jgi:hypothetical protein